MTVTLPWVRPERRTPRHSAEHTISRLRAELDGVTARARAFEAAANDYFDRLTVDRTEVYAAWAQVRGERDEASALAACFLEENLQLRAERDAQQAELTALRAELDNLCAVSVPAPQDTGATDPDPEATQPIPVLPHWERPDLAPEIAVPVESV